MRLTISMRMMRLVPLRRQYEQTGILGDRIAEGVYKDPTDKSTLISELTVSEARELIADGFIGGGMLPKLNNCMEAIEKGVSRVHILDGRVARCITPSLQPRESERLF